jgi:hypothetical protein
MLLDPPAARPAIDLTQAEHGPGGLAGVLDEEARDTVSDDLPAGAQVHGDHGQPGGIGLRQDESESLRDGVQMQQRSRPREQCILARDIHRSDVTDGVVQVGLYLLAEIFSILNNPGDEQWQSAQAGCFDCQVDTLVRMNPA